MKAIISLIGVLTLFFSITLNAQGPSRSELFVDFNNCDANLEGGNFDYEEFTAEFSSVSNGPELELIGNSIYRNDPESNGHSCIIGLNFTSAMCVTAASSCLYNPGDEKSVKFDVKVTSTNSTSSLLQELSFYEASPKTFRWQGGDSGNNNYPTFYALRVLRDGNLIYQRQGISSTRGFTLEEFDFSNNPSFEVDGMAIFNFELLAYCPINNGSRYSLWDLDDLKIKAVSGELEEHRLEGGPFEFCAGDGIDDLIGANAISLSGEGNANTQWIVANEQGAILGLPNNYSEVNFENTGNGNCFIYHLNYEGSISGLFEGSNISNLIGSFDLSNGILVTRNGVNGGVLTGGPFSFCTNDGLADLVLAGDYTLIDNSGNLNQWVVTDVSGTILNITSNISSLDFDNTSNIQCLIRNIAYEEGLIGLEMGNNLFEDLEGCYDISNAMTVDRSSVNAGVLSGGPFDFCIDGRDDFISQNEITLDGNSGSLSSWVVTDAQGIILDIPESFSDVNFDAAGSGICFIYNVTFEADFLGLDKGNNINTDLTGCHDISNPVQVNRTTVTPGELQGGPFSFCVDGIADMIDSSQIALSGNTGMNSAWVVTDTNNVILGLPPHFSAVDFDEAGEGVCLIWHLSFDGELMGDTLGGIATDISGCYALSNSVTVNRTGLEGGILSGGPFSFCVDGIADMIDSSQIALSGNTGMNSAWVVTDTNNVILGLPPHFSAVDFDEAGEGVCLIWHLSFDGELMGDTLRGIATDISGCYALSNSVTVNRTGLEGGILSGGPFSFCVDGIADMIDSSQIALSGNTGMNSAWVVTDTNNVILGLPPHFSAVDFDEAGEGVCLIWHLSFDGELMGDTLGGIATDISGCYALSNAVTVNRTGLEGGTLSGGPFSFCVDGIADMIDSSQITLSGNTGMNSAWVVTDTNNVILGLPPHFSAVDFDEAGEGVCLIWHLSFDGELMGDTLGGIATDISGCYALSNSVTVNRTGLEGGILSGGPFSFCVDGIADMIDSSQIALSGNTGMNSAWVVTDTNNVILGLPPHFSAVDFDEAGEGVCLIWHLSFDGELMGDTLGGIATDISGCYALSNAVTVNRTGLEGGTLSGGPFSFCVDGIPDMIDSSQITLSGNTGMNSAWVVTDTNNVILGLPPHFSAVDFDEAGEGVCLIWHLSFDGELMGDTLGGIATDISGCYALSNSVTVNRTGLEGGILSGGPFSFCVDGIPDMIDSSQITLSGNTGMNSAWVVTDTNNVILGLPPHFSAVDFDEAGEGVCLIWHLSFDGELMGDTLGGIATDISGCYALSNSVTVNRTGLEGGILSGGPFSFCVDGIADMIDSSQIALSGNTGMNSAWVVTDTNNVILGLPPHFSAVDFDEAGEGVCLIWHLSFDGELMGDTLGGIATDISGCYELSNSVTVNRTGLEGGILSGGPFSFCVDGIADMIDSSQIALSGNTGMNSAWVVTDTNNVILGLPPHFSAVDFDEAGEGVCLIWHLSFDGELMGDTLGGIATDISGCYALSNSVTVNRTGLEGGILSGGPFSFCVDGIADMIDSSQIALSGNTGMNSAWVVTDTNNVILGLPPHFSAVDFDEAGEGVCLIWHLSFDGELMGDTIGGIATDISGCYALSNSVTVNRTTAVGGTLNGDSIRVCGNGFNLDTSSISLTGNIGQNNFWIITNSSNELVQLSESLNNINLNDLESGDFLLRNISFAESDFLILEGININEVEGCYDLSNGISIEKSSPVGGLLTSGPLVFCIDDESDMIDSSSISLSDQVGDISQWIITDTNRTIVGLPNHYSDVDFNTTGVGICLIWHLSSDDLVGGLEVNSSLDSLSGCFGLSNSVTVTRTGDASFCTNSDSSSFSIVINEISPNGFIELKNIGSDSVNISSLVLCNFPLYVELASLNIICGSMNIAPDDFIVVDAGDLNITPDDGEMGLYVDDNFTNFESIIDYVEWGFSGHTRAPIAVEAGIWPSDTSATSFSDSMALKYDGMGDHPDDWSVGEANNCEENELIDDGTIETSQLFSFNIKPNPVHSMAELSISNKTESERGILYIYDQMGQLRISHAVTVKDRITNQVNLTSLEDGVYFIRIFTSSQNYTLRFLKM